ncbi:MAG: PQQ-binding-like beta-propeller repeat protein [Planctomycetota bacterium]
MILVAILNLGNENYALADDWTTYQHDAAHTGRSTALFDPTELVKAWSAPQGYSQPLIVGDKVFSMRNQQGIGSDVTSVSSFQLSNGAVNWTYTNHFIFPGQPTLAEGLVLFAAKFSSAPARLYALDAIAGTLKYTVPLNGIGYAPLMPTVARNANGDLVAYVTDGGLVNAVRLGESSGSVMWSGTGSFGGQSIPTVCGNSIILAGPGQFYAFDQLTGAMNHFFSGNNYGGGGSTVACDSTSHQFYVKEVMNSGQGFPLAAFSYVDNSQISQLWQQTGPGIGHGGSVAIGQKGSLFSADGATLLELDPSDGTVLRSLTGLSLAGGITPAITGNSIFLMTETQTQIYDLDSFALRRSLQGSRGSLNTAYDSPGAVFDSGFALDYGNIYGSRGFDVFRVPEPSTLSLIGVGAIGIRRFRKSASVFS